MSVTRIFSRPWELLKSLAWALREQGRTLDVTLGGLQDTASHFDADGSDDSKRSDRQPHGPIRCGVMSPAEFGAGEPASNQGLLQFSAPNHHAEQRWVAANCAGVGVLHRAGILTGGRSDRARDIVPPPGAQGTRVVTHPDRRGKSTPCIGYSPPLVPPPCMRAR
jgi:hypothetical protein